MDVITFPWLVFDPVLFKLAGNEDIHYILDLFEFWPDWTTYYRVIWGRTGLVVRASDSGSGDPGSILGRVGVLFP